MQINFEKRMLDNGLTVLVHQDKNTPMVAFNLLYNVGSRDEDAEHTGLAHLFEHLMFSGSTNVKDIDLILEKVGGENNAFTNNDFTNYYIHLPKDKIEVAFEVESDRMQYLSLSDQKIKIQKEVVIEEFKERYLNRPYGDTYQLLRPLSYKAHPYAWSTIGKDVSHIEQMDKERIKDFYNRYYKPDNAILCVAGPVKAEDIFKLSEKWFGGIAPGKRPKRNLIPEPEQTEARKLKVVRSVPNTAIYKAYHMGERMSKEFYCFDLISDLFSNGKSSRFYIDLVKEQRLFNQVDAYVSADIEPGTFIIGGQLCEGISFAQAEEAIQKHIDRLLSEVPAKEELEKIKNKLETALFFSNMKALDKATNLCYFELMGGANLLSAEMDEYRAVSGSDMQHFAKLRLREENCSTLYYVSENDTINQDI